MICAWNELLSVIPQHMRRSVDMLGKDTMQELRLRLGKPAELVLKSGSQWLPGEITSVDINFVVNTASRYSPWAATSLQNGYITALGGHRIGVCGECIAEEGNSSGIRSVSSLCIRVARDISGISPDIRSTTGSVLILGPPGSGKTTLLRDLIRNISDKGPESIAVVDERCEVFPQNCGFSSGIRTDVLSGCTKRYGVNTVLRTMGPGWIAVDEITAEEDCEALLQAGWCGVRLLATVHASSKEDLLNRSIYVPLAKSGLFQTVIVLRPDKSWKMERMRI